MGAGKSKNASLLLETVIDHEKAINCMALSDDRSMLVTGGTVIDHDNDICLQLFCPLEGGGSRGGGGRGGRSKMGRLDRNSDARCGRSYRSNSVRGVGCEEQEKTWVVWGANPQEGQMGLGTSPILSR